MTGTSSTIKSASKASAPGRKVPTVPTVKKARWEPRWTPRNACGRGTSCELSTLSTLFLNIIGRDIGRKVTHSCHKNGRPGPQQLFWGRHGGQGGQSAMTVPIRQLNPGDTFTQSTTTLVHPRDGQASTTMDTTTPSQARSSPSQTPRPDGGKTAKGAARAISLRLAHSSRNQGFDDDISM
jgi:hypothetical protein